MKKLLLFVLSGVLLYTPATTAAAPRIGAEQIGKAEALKPGARNRAQEVDDATEDMGTGIDNTREKRERNQQQSLSAREGNIQSREQMIRSERERLGKAQNFLKSALTQRERATRVLVESPASKDARTQFKNAQQSVQTGATELNKCRDNIYRLQIANDKDRYGRDWVEKSETVRPKPYVPPIVRLDGPVKPAPQPRDASRTAASGAARTASEEAAKAAAEAAAAEAAKEAAKAAGKDTAKKTAKETSKGATKSSASSAAHPVPHSPMHSH